MTRSSSRGRHIGEGGERSHWERRAKEIMARVEPVLGSSLSEDTARFLERQTARVARFGTYRKSPIISMSAHIGNYWCGVILQVLRIGLLRPSEIRALINAASPAPPISQRMLTLNLRQLERDGLIERHIYLSGQTRVEYLLTELGQQLSDFMVEIVEWGERNVEKIVSARQEFDARNDGLYILEPVEKCA